MLAQKAPIHLQGRAEQPGKPLSQCMATSHAPPRHFSCMSYAACSPCCLAHTLGAILEHAHDMVWAVCPDNFLLPAHTHT